jgi:1-acyl-sn-glycerol-3-phosphate acyltransferase
MTVPHLAAAPCAAADDADRQTRGRALYESVVFYGLLALFGLMSLSWSLAAALLHRLLPRRWGEPLGQRMMTALCRAFVSAMRRSGIIQCDLAALDRLRTGPGVIIAPNHPSLLDAVLVISRLPRVVCAAKAEIWDNPFLGGSARLAGFVRNDGAARLVRRAARQVAANRHFLIFPEGTRSTGQAPGDFKGGFALIAKKADAAVQTVFIESNSRFLGKGWPLFRKPAFPLVYRVRLGRRFTMTGSAQEFVRELSAYYRHELGAERR